MQDGGDMMCDLLNIDDFMVYNKKATLPTVILNKKFELMLTRRAKAYNNSCSQTVSLSPAISSHSFLECSLQPKIAKINKNFLFWKFRSFKVIGVDTTEKLVTSACCAHAYLQPFSRKTG